MVSICVCHTYADARHMDMLNLCCILSFPGQIRIRSEKRLFRICFPASGAQRPNTQDVAVFSDGDDAICCVPPLPRDRPLTTGKRRFAYSLTVVHFRKVVIRKKIGSAGNGHPV
uniref:Uncharacterized protein n=1 Tax=Escherichia coli TaxID=562 RepID=A0A7G3NRR1_ECOLX|nr:hypothetical protein HPPIBGPI_00312 [Escherichia coli]